MERRGTRRATVRRVPIFRRPRRPPRDPRPGIAAFWKEWAGIRPHVLAALDRRQPDAVADAVSDAVRRLHPDLEWELAAGTAGAQHALAVSAGGRAELRSLAQRWWLAAPPADARMEYHPARQRDPNAATAVLTLEDIDLPAAELVAGTRLDTRRHRLDLQVHHPLMPLLSDDARLQLVFLSLDAALGEDDVERWIGTVDVALDEPLDAVPLSSLGPLVDGMPRGSGAWATFTGESPEGVVVGVVRHPFARVDRPLPDMHVAVSLGYPAGADGLPDDAALADRVAKWEEQAVEVLGGDGEHVVLVGHVNGRGRCLVHLYVDGLEVDPAELRSLVAGWPAGPAGMHVSADPAWREIGHLLP
jgi:hypothetical protein